MKRRRSALGREYRAARLGPSGLDRLVTVLRFGPEVSSHAEATKRLIEEARLAARFQNPGLVRVLGIGRVEQSFYVSTELVEGRSVAVVLERCRAEAFPFGADHALMIASRAASALESLHGKRDEAGAALVHGLVAPSRLVVAFDGEVKVKGLGLWPALRGTDLLPAEERRYLAPEQTAGGPGDVRSDVYSLGLVLLEALTGQAADSADPLAGLGAASLTSTAGERSPLPTPLARVLRRALDREPDQRFAGMADFRKAIDTLLFSGDFAPTTFDLAFFMNTLFRDDMEREARALEEARGGDYREFLAEEKPAVTLPADTEPEGRPVPRVPPAPTSPGLVEATTAASVKTPAAGTRPALSERPSSVPGPGPDASGTRAARVSREAAAREAAARMTLGGTAVASGRRRGLWLLLGVLGALVVGGGAGFLYFVKLRGRATPPAPSAEASAAQARVHELEARIARLEREKAEAETRAADEARRTVEAQAASRGRAVDPAAVQRAQEEARQRARTEQEQKQQEERHRLAEERNVRGAAACGRGYAHARPGTRLDTHSNASSGACGDPDPGGRCHPDARARGDAHSRGDGNAACACADADADPRAHGERGRRRPATDRSGVFLGVGRATRRGGAGEAPIGPRARSPTRTTRRSSCRWSCPRNGFHIRSVPSAGASRPRSSCGRSSTSRAG